MTTSQFAEADQERHVHGAPQQPGERAVEPRRPAEVGHCGLPADGGQGGEVPVAERLAAGVCGSACAISTLATYSPCCLATGATPGSCLPSASVQGRCRRCRRSPHHPAPRRVRPDLHPACAILLRTPSQFRGRRGFHAGRPARSSASPCARLRSATPSVVAAVTCVPRRTSTPQPLQRALRRAFSAPAG